MMTNLYIAILILLAAIILIHATHVAAKKGKIRLSIPLCPKVWDPKKHEWVSGSYNSQESNYTGRTKNCA